MNALEAAIDELYSAFGKIRKPRHIKSCPCCADEDAIEALLSFDVRYVPAEVLNPYARSALLTVGSPEDYVYYLPRILHLHATDEQFHPDPELTGRAISEPTMEDWPENRKQAIQNFFGHLIRRSLHPDHHLYLDSWMCMIGNARIDVKPYLSDIENARSAALYYFEENAETLPDRRLANVFWDMPNLRHDEIVDWFHSPAIRKIPFEEYGYQFPSSRGDE